MKKCGDALYLKQCGLIHIALTSLLWLVTTSPASAQPGLMVNLTWSATVYPGCVQSGAGNISLDTSQSWTQLVADLNNATDFYVKSSGPISISAPGCENPPSSGAIDFEIWGNLGRAKKQFRSVAYWVQNGDSIIYLDNSSPLYLGAKTARVTEQQISADLYSLPMSGSPPVGKLKITPVNSGFVAEKAYAPPHQSYSPPPPHTDAPPAPPPPTAAESAADRLLADSDRLLAKNGALLTYISFANHNGLHPDRTWGVGISNNGQNDADSIGLNNCNSQVPFGGQQCGSKGSCTLTTGQWAAYAIATVPFMNSDGPYLSATSCGLPSQAAAQAQALRDCQSNAGGTMQCSVVWSGVGR